jgi:tRNA (uracil-5-)-methyltransferase TRM9
MNYDAFATTFSNSRKNHPWPELEAIITDMKQSGVVSILDVGCGNGRCIEEAEKLWYHVEVYLGTDNSRGMIEEARKLHTGYHFEVCDMIDIWTVTTERSFDAIVFLASFHHLTTREDRIKTLKEAQKILTPEGKIYMTNWNLLEQPRYADAHLGNGEFSIKIGEYNRYYHGFTLGELAELFEETWYNILDHRVFEGGRNIYSILSKKES